MFQKWCDITFLHWRYPVDVVQRLLPHPLQAHTFDGSAWVGVTPFLLRDLRPPILPSVPWLSTFPETNCRTYVTAPDGSTGVWFFSLDAARAAAVAGARIGYGLPYFWSRMRVGRAERQMRYESSRLWPYPRVTSVIQVEKGSPIQARELETFLTARFRLYSFILGRLTYTDVDHAPWPLRSAHVISARQRFTSAAGLPESTSGPIAHFSPGVHVRVARPKRLLVRG